MHPQLVDMIDRTQHAHSGTGGEQLFSQGTASSRWELQTQHNAVIWTSGSESRQHVAGGRTEHGGDSAGRDNDGGKGDDCTRDLSKARPRDAMLLLYICTSTQRALSMTLSICGECPLIAAAWRLRCTGVCMIFSLQASACHKASCTDAPRALARGSISHRPSEDMQRAYP